jgi:hypothetical protein
MRVYVAVFALCLIAAILTSQPNSSSRKSQIASPAQGNHGEAVGVNGDKDKTNAKDAAAATNDSPPDWYASPAWWLIPIGIITFGAICWQAVEMRRATDAMRRNTDLQKASIRQWLVLEFIKSKFNESLFEPSGEIKQHLSIELRLQAVNKTPLPLTIKKVVTKISRHVEGREPEWEAFEVEDREILPPVSDGKGGVYPFFVPLQLNGKEVKTYQTNQFIVSISSHAFFESAAGGAEEHTSGSLVRCGPFEDVILPYVGKNPRRPQGQDKPN